jgi:hypothetical protein
MVSMIIPFPLYLVSSHLMFTLITTPLLRNMKVKILFRKYQISLKVEPKD